jgi:hypothetical protein
MPDDDATEPLVLRLVLERTEHLAGVVSRTDGSGEQRFGGWIDFMTALNALRSQAGGQPGGD